MPAAKSNSSSICYQASKYQKLDLSKSWKKSLRIETILINYWVACQSWDG